jgi:TP901 family phage tail tape measure protein
MTQTQVLAAIGPTLQAAAADGLDLASAAGIVSKNLARFGMKASEAKTVADQLAFVSAKTNTNMSQLEEGLKFMGPTARDLGISLADTAAGLGALADVGLQATLGGTALKNAMLKIAAASKKGKFAVAGQKVEIVKTDKGAVDMLGTFQNLIKRLKDIPDKTERAAVAMKVLGLRGLGAKTAFESLGKEKIADLFGKLKRNADGTVTRLGGVAKNSKDVASKMAKIRLDTMAGKFTILKSAVEGVTISFGEAVTKSLSVGGGVEGITKILGEAAAAFEFFGKRGAKSLDSSIKGVPGIRDSVLQAVQGILQGLRDVGKVLKKVFGFFSSMSGVAGGNTARLITTVAGLAAAFTPVMLAIKGATSLFKGMAQVAIGAGKVVAGALGAAAKVGGGLLSKIPGVAKMLPGIAGKLGRAVGAVESITAAPVRVTNFHEMGGMGGALGGLGGLGGGAGGAGRAAGGLAAKLRAIGQMNVGAAFSAAGRGAWGAAKALPGLVAKFGPAAAGIAAAGAAGFAFGTWLDKKFGISSKLADGLWKLFNRTEHLQSQARVRVHAHKVQIKTVNEMTKRLIDFNKRGIAIQTQAGGPKQKVTRKLAEQQIRKFLTSKNIGKSKEEADRIIAGMASQLRGIKDAPTKVEVKLDGKVIASAVAKKKTENAARAGKTAPGTGRKAAQGGR